MRRVPAALALSVAVLPVALLTAACGSDDPTLDRSTSGDVTAGATGPASPVAPGTSAPTAAGTSDGGGAAGPQFVDAASTAEQPAEGNGLSVVDVRTGRHIGYDRVVFELDGDGTVGWRVHYDDAPAEPGSGEPVDVEGEAALAVLLNGVGYPFDTGIEQYAGAKRPSPRLPQVRQLHLGAVYEGSYDAVIGVAQRAPFRVFRLTDPQRVVVDVRHQR